MSSERNIKKVAMHNLGCKVNAYETEAMMQLLIKAGYEVVPFSELADIYIINTCTVTNMADRKSRQMLHKAKKKNPQAVVIAAGCYAQTSTEKIDESIDIIVGNNRKKDIVEILEQYYSENHLDSVIDTRIDINHTKEYEDLNLEKTNEHTRAYIKVQDGCNQFCSYCAIPFARGRVRSRDLSSVIEEVRRLANNGYKEVVLTGIHLSSYGVDFEEQVSLLELILAVNEIEGIKRIRLGSLEPRIITEEFAKELSKLEKFCPHFHLSLQSGCDETLKRMNRRYTADEYFEKCEILRKYFEHPALTTDVIVGFPGETEEEFEQSKAFIDKVNFYETHIFKYSKRAGTKAAVMDHQVSEEVKTIRSNELIQMNLQKQLKFEAEMIPSIQEVLVEETVEIDGVVCQVGHTKEYVKLKVFASENLENQLIDVKLENFEQIVH